MWDWIPKLAELKASGKRFVIATVTKIVGSTPREVGARMLICEGGEFFGTIGGGKLEALALEDAKGVLETGEPKTGKYPLCIRAGQCCGGAVDVFFEVVNTGPLLYLYGAGHVGQAVCKVLEGTPFEVHCIDEREEWIESAELPACVFRHKSDWKTFNDRAEWNQGRTYVAVMTYLHDLDLAIVGDVLSRDAKFVGLIGSNTKWQRFTQRLKSMDKSDEKIDKVHCPIGIPTGGKSPKEVAISIAAQLLQLHYGSSAQSEDDNESVEQK